VRSAGRADLTASIRAGKVASASPAIDTSTGWKRMKS